MQSSHVACIIHQPRRDSALAAAHGVAVDVFKGMGVKLKDGSDDENGNNKSIEE